MSPALWGWMENHGHVEAKFGNDEESEASHEAAAPQIQDIQSEEESVKRNYRRSRQNQEVKDMQFQARYEDTESYVEQRAHSIGEGLYCTDDYQDLPPRFKKKFLSLLESVGFKIDHSKSEIVCFSPNTNIDFGRQNSESHKSVKSTVSVNDTSYQNQSSSSQSLSSQDDKASRQYWSDNKFVATNKPFYETSKNIHSKSNHSVDIVKEHSDPISQQQKETDIKSDIKLKERNWNNRRGKQGTDFNNENPYIRKNPNTEYSNQPEYTSSHNQNKGGKFTKEVHNDKFCHQKKNENFDKGSSHQKSFGKSIKDEVQNFIEQNRDTTSNLNCQTVKSARKPHSAVSNKVRENCEDSDNIYYYKAGKNNYKHGSDFAHGKVHRNDSYRRASNTSQPNKLDGSKDSNSSLENRKPMSRQNSAVQNQKSDSKNASNYSDHNSHKAAQVTYKDSHSNISSSVHSNKPNFNANKFSNKESSTICDKDTEFRQDRDKSTKVPLIDRSPCKSSSVDARKENNSPETVKTLKDSRTVFENYVNNLYSKLEIVETMLDVRKLRVDFSRECNSFARCLPIYSQKEKILELLRFYSVSVIVAETGSGKSTQLVEYFLQTDFAARGTIICTQPRKIAAIGLAEYVSKQLGSSVGKIVGYDIGLEKKYSEESKILYVTDYCLLKRILVNKKLSGISCVIVDEAHERTLHTDLLLSLLKLCIVARPDFRVVITSATINPTVFRNYFSLKDEMIISIPGRLYPVEVIWLEEDVDPDWNYLEACVKLAHHIHAEKNKGDILVFLTSPSEVEDAVQLFKTMCKKNSLPQLIGLHGKSDLNEQRLIFQSSIDCRKVIFATNSAETSLTIPGIKFVIDSGMAKEKIYFPRKNKSSLVVSFINRSSAEQRKGRAGRTQPGVCYRMYSKNNYYNHMKERALPELLKTNIQTAILKIMEFGVEPKDFDFVESPPKEAFSKSLESLELLGAVENNKLTDMGRRINQMTIEPRLAKLVLEGIRNEIGYETIIIASLVSESAKLFSRNEFNRDEADKMKVKFCKKEGDLWTFLDVYKQWQEVPWKDRDAWCTRNYISSRALRMASKSVDEILKNLRLDLSIHVLKRYNNSAFKANFQNVIFSCYSENLCVFSGHPRVGYFSPYLSESFCIHPSSAISYLRMENPMFLVYSNLMETSRNFMLDVTPLSEEILRKECGRGVYKLDIAMLKRFQILPKVLGPFGESVLIRHVLGKGGRKIVELESMIERYTRTKNFKIDVLVDKGEIIIYVEKRFHEKIANYINEMVTEAHKEMLKEEDTIRMPKSSSYCCLGAGGIISDIIMPGEFKEITIELQNFKTVNEVVKKLEEFGELRSFKVKNEHNRRNICVAFEKVSQARTALLQLNKERGIHFVRSNIFIPKEIKKSLPLFTLDVSWCRRPVSGYGFVEFKSEPDCVIASGTLARSSFYINDKYINFAPSKHSPRELHMTNLPAMVNEEMIEAKLKERLPAVLTVKNVNLMRSKQDKLTEEDIGRIKSKLLKLFGKYSASDKMIIDVKYPKSSDVYWRAFVYFENIKDGESAFKQLNGKAEIDSFPVKLKQVLTSRLFCNLRIYKAVESEIEKFVRMKEKVCDQFSSEYNSKTENIVIKFGCKNILELNAMQQTILNLILGRQINCFGNSKYLFLFSQNGKSLLKSIQDSTCTYICVNDLRRILSIYGSHEACREAELRIHSLATAPTTWKVFDIKRSSMPSGFLKALYSKYGFDLYELLNTCKLKVANVDVVAGTLTLEGDKENVKKAENELEEICSQLSDSSNQNVLEDNQESCPICLETINYDFLRLEHCGHAFCRQCLLLQLESKSIPVKCIKENCGKFLFLEDIKKILSSGGQDLKKSFCLAAVQYHVNSNLDKLSYCPTPDCPMLYRRSNETLAEFNCPLCENIICRNCQTLYHHGMSCEMYINSKEDSDYSLKCWMKENDIDRKLCPQCKVPIEKNSGCNHIECLNCKAHLCWPCLKVFPKGEDVYEHQPYCVMNQ
ncbi:uncharacterized protein LOC129230554 [Uloborus diversus]|uniref:uncharacterized protein LOC129230554 n=1 Tax=Uloborus diversus TaxID=327109 RepID=UPI0024095578|nr:uncharacterized protein LOC129230554 [Uloborus diversus]